MEFAIRQSLRSTDEAVRATRRWFYWPLLVLRGSYGLLLGFAITVAALRALLHLLRPNFIMPTGYLLICAAAIFAIIIGALIKREDRKRRKLIAEIGSAQMTLSDEGIGTVDAKGVRHFSPWGSYSQFKEGKTVFLLKLSTAKKYLPIPKDCLTELEAASLRSILLSHLPEA